LDVTEPSFLTPDRILAHPAFAQARNAHIAAILDLYEGRPSLIELMRDGGRIMVYGILMAHWGGYREDDPTSLPTISRLKQTIGWFEVASPRKIDLILARFAQVGHLQVTPAPQDLRMRIILPTPALIDHDRAFVAAHYCALAELFGREAYALPLAGDLAFLRAMRKAWVASLESMAQEIFIANPPIMRFYAASAGMLMLMKLVQQQTRSPDAWLGVDYTDFGRRFGVSRTHVRTLLKAVAADGDIGIDANGRLRLSPGLIAALDRNIAGRLSLLDRAHSTAMASLAKAVLDGPGIGPQAS
jgi:hypothetical protein